MALGSIASSIPPTASTGIDWTSFSYRSPNLSEQPTRGNAIEDFESKQSVVIGGVSRSMAVSKLSPPRAITMGITPDFLCDCHDLTLSPRSFRLHMFYSRGPETLTFDQKLKRMTDWQEAILAFDSVMTGKKGAEVAEISRGLKDFVVPRAEYAILPTENRGIRQLFMQLGALDQGELFFPWDRLVELCRSGALVENWRVLKGK